LIFAINPANKVASAELSVAVPVVGHVRVAEIYGPLADGQRAKAEFDALVASGNITLHLKKNDKDPLMAKHDLRVSYKLTSSFVGTISRDDYHLVTLP
jgi:hypothetical protein